MGEIAKPVVYFFGCTRGVDGDNEAGHSWRASNGTDAHKSGSPFGRYPDGTLCPEGSQFQGAAILHQKEGWTALGFWDRTGDSRGNSNSNFIVQGTYTFDEMVALSKEAFPGLWKRIVTVTHHSTNAPDIQGFVIKHVNDENIEIALHGHFIVSLSHDSDGWNGIEKAQEIVNNIAEILKLSVRESR